MPSPNQPIRTTRSDVGTERSNTPVRGANEHVAATDSFAERAARWIGKKAAAPQPSSEATERDFWGAAWAGDDVRGGRALPHGARQEPPKAAKQGSSPFPRLLGRTKSDTNLQARRQAQKEDGARRAGTAELPPVPPLPARLQLAPQAAQYDNATRYKTAAAAGEQYNNASRYVAAPRSNSSCETHRPAAGWPAQAGSSPASQPNTPVSVVSADGKAGANAGDRTPRGPAPERWGARPSSEELPALTPLLARPPLHMNNSDTVLMQEGAAAQYRGRAAPFPGPPAQLSERLRDGRHDGAAAGPAAVSMWQADSASPGSSLASSYGSSPSRSLQASPPHSPPMAAAQPLVWPPKELPAGRPATGDSSGRSSVRTSEPSSIVSSHWSSPPSSQRAARGRNTRSRQALAKTLGYMQDDLLRNLRLSEISTNPLRPRCQRDILLGALPHEVIQLVGQYLMLRAEDVQQLKQLQEELYRTRDSSRADAATVECRAYLFTLLGRIRRVSGEDFLRRTRLPWEQPEASECERRERDLARFLADALDLKSLAAFYHWAPCDEACREVRERSGALPAADVERLLSTLPLNDRQQIFMKEYQERCQSVRMTLSPPASIDSTGTSERSYFLSAQA